MLRLEYGNILDAVTNMKCVTFPLWEMNRTRASLVRRFAIRRNDFVNSRGRNSRGALRPRALAHTGDGSRYANTRLRSCEPICMFFAHASKRTTEVRGERTLTEYAKLPNWIRL